MRKLLPISAEDFGLIAAKVGPCELVNGEIVPMAPGHVPHSEVAANITIILGSYAKRTKLGRVLGNEAGIVVKRDPDTVRGADALYISYKRLPAARKPHGWLQHVPELIVEVLGKEDSWQDIEEKVSEYQHIGVDLVWVADPKTWSVRVYPLKDEAFILHDDDMITGGKLMPGFKCRVGEFFE
jgi:Uma2 family endonuclease